MQRLDQRVDTFVVATTQGTQRDQGFSQKWCVRLRERYAGSLRAAQVVENFADFRKRERGEPELCYLVGVVALAFRKALNASRVRLSTTEFLLAYRGKAYVLQNDYSVVRSSHGYTAIGVGAEIANGALSVLAENMDARDVVERALRAAERHSTKVGGRLHVTCV